MLKICMTGGPCGGKSSAFEFLEEKLTERGYFVYLVPESATELIINGIRPNDDISLVDFQRFVLEKQLAKEKLYNNLVKYVNSDKIIIFYDRGILDSLAYINKDIMQKLLNEMNLTFNEVMNHYDAVLHLVTAADGASDYYVWNDPSKDDVGNNAARSESPAEAIIKDRLTLDAWIGHPHLRVFDNSTNFTCKIQKVVEEVFALLGEPVPKEIERKYLIKKPMPMDIEEWNCCTSISNIIQTYLYQKDNKVERRVRQRGSKENGFLFYYTEKSDIKIGERFEIERKISPEEYINYLSESDTSLHQISKTRYCFMYRNQYFELDLYPFSEEYAILEIEVNSMDDKVDLPNFIDIVKEVTDDIEYKNHSLAKTLCLKISDKSPLNMEDDWTYETGKEVSEILGSGSNYYDVAYTKDINEALKLCNEKGRTYLYRYKKNDRSNGQSYNKHSKTWMSY